MRPSEILVDGGYVQHEAIDQAAARGVTVYGPVPKSRKPDDRDPRAPRSDDSKAVATWRARMATDEAKDIYRDRAATAETVNADAKAVARRGSASPAAIDAPRPALTSGARRGATHSGSGFSRFGGSRLSRVEFMGYAPGPSRDPRSRHGGPSPMLCRSRFREFTAGAVPLLLALVLGTGCGQAPTHGNAQAPATGAGKVTGGDAGSLAPEPEPDCGLHLTAYPGDCKAPPGIDPSVGVVAHYGPRDYDDPDQIAQYLVQPGQELVDCAYSTLSNDQDLYYARYDVYSRPGMHHVILSATNAPATDGLHDDCTERDHGARLLAVLQGGIRGNVYHYPPSDNQPPENAGIGTKLPPHQSIAYELHAVNTTEAPLLKENWTVFYAMPADQVTETAGQIAFNGGLSMNIPPHTKQTIQNSCLVNNGLGKIRVTDFFGHMHAHGKRFSAWAVQTDDAGTETHSLIYESYDWSKLDLIEFNSVQKNTPVVYKSGTPGGISGDLFLSPGDRIEYECEMDNTEDFSLNFAAKALTGEMCNLFGSFTPGGLWSCVGY